MLTQPSHSRAGPADQAAQPSLPPEAWTQIRAGVAPNPQNLEAVLAPRAALLGADGLERQRGHLAAHVLGVGALDDLVRDPMVTDVLVNSTRGTWVDRGEGLVPVPLRFDDDEDVRRLAVRLAGTAGRRLDDACPYVDGLLPAGLRLHAVLPPLSDGVHLSLRVPRLAAPTLDDLEGLGGVDGRTASVLRAVLARRRSFVVTGGTGSGKTTVLAALLAEVPNAERIVVVEDVRELAIAHPHVVRLQTRPANVEGTGQVDLACLVRHSLRMRPDRLVVGEVRGAEVRELLTALNTGHEGGCGTMHANAPRDVVARFQALGALAGLTPEAVNSQLASAVDVVIHLRREGSRRHVDCIGVLRRVRGGRVAVAVALRRANQTKEGPILEPGPAWAVLAELIGVAPNW